MWNVVLSGTIDRELKRALTVIRKRFKGRTRQSVKATEPLTRHDTTVLQFRIR